MTTDRRTGDPLSDHERNRRLERIFLEYVYRPADFAVIEQRERPDFALATKANSQSFGVEITTLFSDESHARMYLKPGYMEELWKGAKHVHKDDIDILKVVSGIKVYDQDGNLRQDDLTGIVVESQTQPSFLEALQKRLEDKSCKSYDYASFTHIDLVIYSFYGQQFDANDFRVSEILSPKVGATLVNSKFREITLILRSSSSQTEDPSDTTTEPENRKLTTPTLKRLGLKQLYLTDRFYNASGLIAEHLSATLDKGYDEDEAVELLNRLTCDLIVRRLGIGTLKDVDGVIHVQFGPCAIGAKPGTIEVLDSVHFPQPDWPAATVGDRLPPAVEESICAKLASLTSSTNWAEDAFDSPTALANRPPPAQS